MKKGGIPGAPSAKRALDALYQDREGERPYIAYAFLALCLLVTVPTLFIPRLYDVFGGIEPRRHPWQLFTAAFEHGWPGFPGSVHLALNVFLILECGRPTERLLEHARFLALGLFALLANAMVLSLTEGVNGSSLVIWSWGPALYVALRWGKKADPAVTGSGSYVRLRGLLILMYGIIVAVMGLLPYLFGSRLNPLASLLIGNLFHLVATAVGMVFAWASVGFLRTRLRSLGTSAP